MVPGDMRMRLSNPSARWVASGIASLSVAASNRGYHIESDADRPRLRRRPPLVLFVSMLETSISPVSPGSGPCLQAPSSIGAWSLRTPGAGSTRYRLRDPGRRPGTGRKVQFGRELQDLVMAAPGQEGRRPRATASARSAHPCNRWRRKSSVGHRTNPRILQLRFTSAIVTSPKWKMLAASTASAPACTPGKSSALPAPRRRSRARPRRPHLLDQLQSRPPLSRRRPSS